MPRAVDEVLLAILERNDRGAALAEAVQRHPELAAELRLRLRVLSDFGMVDLADAAGGPSDGLSRDRLGPYRLLRKLGAGGMGIVWLAEQEPLGRRVALKMLSGAGLYSERARERFRREALALSRLDHPSICPVYDVGESDGTPWMAMRLVEGNSLEQLLAQARRDGARALALVGQNDASRLEGTRDSQSGRQARDRVLEFVERAARAVHAAHEAGFVHRDLKPGNIMVTPAGEPVLLDFGLARAAAGEHASLTLSGDPIGTPAYMAPEQIRGDRQDVDRRSDVYALGVVLYECLTLRLPFDAADRESLYREILHREPPSPRRFDRRIERDTCVVLATALAKEPTRRYQSAEALADELARLREHRPIKARAAGPVLRLRRWVERNRLAAALLGALSLALIAALVAQQQTRFAARSARAIGLAGKAGEAVEIDPVRAVLLARESVRTLPTPEGWTQLTRALANAYEVASCPHPGRVGGVRLVAGERQLLTICDDGQARLFSSRGQCVREFRAHTQPIECLAVDPRDSTRFVTGCSDGQAFLWSTEADEPLRALQFPRPIGGSWSTVRNVAFSPVSAAQPFLITSRGDVVWRWATDGSGEPQLVTRHETLVTDLAISPDGGILASTGLDGSVHRTDLATGEIRQLRGHQARAWHVCFAPDGSRFATATGDGSPYGRDNPAPDDNDVRLWDREGQELGAFFPQRQPFFGLAISNTHVAACSRDGTLYVSDHGGRRHWVKDTGNAAAMRFSTDGGTLLVAARELLFLDLDGGVRRRLFKPANCVDLAWSADGMRVAAAFWNGTARLYDLRGGAIPAIDGFPMEDLGDAVWSPDGRWLAYTQPADRVVLVERATMRQVAQLPLPRNHRRQLDWCQIAPLLLVNNLLFDVSDPEASTSPLALLPTIRRPNAARFVVGRTDVVTAHDDGSAHVLTRDGAVLHRLPPPADDGSGSARHGLLAADVSRDGELLVVLRRDARVQLYRLGGDVPQEIGSVTLPAARGVPGAGSVRFAADGREVLAANADRCAYCIALPGLKVTSVAPRSAAVVAAEYDRDGRRILTAGGGSVACVHDRASGELLFALSCEHSYVPGARFSADGRAILTVSWDGLARVWPSDPDELQRIAERWPHRDFTDDELSLHALLIDGR